MISGENFNHNTILVLETISQHQNNFVIVIMFCKFFKLVHEFNKYYEHHFMYED